MQFNTILKFGSLAIDVAQDEKIRELATMIHKGAKRRGVFAPYSGPVPGAPSPAPLKEEPAPKSKIPFAPATTPSQLAAPALPPIEKLFTVGNAKKALSWAGVVKDILIK